MCIFCRIVRRELPARLLIETESVVSFLDAFPLSAGHCLVIPRRHYEFLHEVPEATAAEMGRVVSRLARALHGASPPHARWSYNVLQNNGAAAHQAVPHVHFHLIPKEGKSENGGGGRGLKLVWEPTRPTPEALDAVHAQIMANIL